MRTLAAIAIMVFLSVPTFGQKQEIANNNTRQKNRPAAFKNIAGTYKGMLPCADCSGIEATLVLELASDTTNGPHGPFHLTAKYLNTKHQDSVHTIKETWWSASLSSGHKKVPVPDSFNYFIALEGETPGSSFRYGYKKNGDLVPIYLDTRTLKIIDTSSDLTLKKQ